MKRREFMAILGGAAAAGIPLATHAQQRPNKIPRIGIIDDGPDYKVIAAEPPRPRHTSH